MRCCQARRFWFGDGVWAWVGWKMNIVHAASGTEPVPETQLGRSRQSSERLHDIAKKAAVAQLRSWLHICSLYLRFTPPPLCPLVPPFASPM